MQGASCQREQHRSTIPVGGARRGLHVGRTNRTLTLNCRPCGLRGTEPIELSLFFYRAPALWLAWHRTYRIKLVFLLSPGPACEWLGKGSVPARGHGQGDRSGTHSSSPATACRRGTGSMRPLLFVVAGLHSCTLCALTPTPVPHTCPPKVHSGPAAGGRGPMQKRPQLHAGQAAGQPGPGPAAAGAVWRTACGFCMAGNG